MNSLTPTDCSSLSGLPVDVRTDAYQWNDALNDVSKPIGKALMVLAKRFGVNYATARRKYDDWKDYGIRGLVNCAKAGLKREAFLAGLEDGASDAMFRNREFRGYVKALAEKYQRKSRPAHREFCRQWKGGKPIPGLDASLPRTEIPPGCGEDNFYRRVKDCVALEAMRSGLGKAVAKYGPKIFTTRAELWYGSHLMIDDLWHDNFVVFARQIVRVLELDALDVFSGNLETFGCKPRIRRTDGTFENLKEDYARLVVANVLFHRGFSPRGTEILAEHGTAAISERVARILHDATKGLIRLRESGITGQEQAIIGWSGQGKGNPRFKAALESLRNLKHNELAAIPAQTGKDRDSRPEYTHGQLVQCSNEIKVLEMLARKHPARAADFRLKLWDYHAQFLPMLMAVYQAINDRDWHDLEGWHKANNVQIQYRTTPTSDQWLTGAEFAALPEVSQQLLLSAAAADKRYIREHRMPPSEVARRDAGTLVKIPPFVVCDILGEDCARELKVAGAYFHEFQDRELDPEALLFESLIITPDGREEQLRDDKYQVFVNPFDLHQLFVCDARLRCLGIARRSVPINRADPEALKAAYGRRSHRLAQLTKPLLERHAEAVREETKRMAHNSALIEAENDELTQLDDAADEAMRRAMTTT